MRQAVLSLSGGMDSSSLLLHLLNNNKINYKLYGNFSNQKLLYKIFNTILNRHNKKILYCKRNNKNEFN